MRDFVIHNALYWLDEYRFDGLRLDAVHAIVDESERHLLNELAERVRAHFAGRRAVHLVLENDANQARFLDRRGHGPRHYDAQWNDDWHHVAHVVLTGETGGYYADYADGTMDRLARALTEGFVYQGEPVRYARRRDRAASRARIFHPSPSSPSSRTTTRSATGRWASA